MVAGRELTYDTNATAMQMANTIFGNGVTVTGASYSGSSYSSAIYSNGDAVAGNVTPADTGVILSTGSATLFTNNNWRQSNFRSNTSVNSGGENNEAGFNELAGTNTYDASYIDVDFIPTNDTMTMQFVFSSEEYPEYTNSIYNDAVGVWINGNLVPLAVTENGTTINSINDTNNINLYQDNAYDQYNTEMDGFTITMTLTIPVNVGEVNSIRIGIADVSDSNYDSNLLIAANSVQTELVAEQDHVTMQDSVTKTVDVLGNDINNTNGTLTITHINGIAVTAGQTVTLTTGQTVKLNADGTFDITTDSDFETSSFTYQIASTNAAGATIETDVGFVTVETIPCFVAGTLIGTPQGPRPVEALVPGDMVLTRDEGPRPVRWIGRRSVPAVGKMAPVCIKANALGEHGELRVSPLHRILVEDARAELLFGDSEVLIAARDLVNDHSIRSIDGGEVEYVHLLFDRHQVIYAEGLATESFLPGPQTTRSFEAEIIAEITAIFPELDLLTGAGYGPAARPLLKRFEAETLRPRVA
ncbi:Hint domain-containing protein [Thalassorhabdomicrobium marinisediminis]|uniref:2,3,4,5-tetrahydropyridine-2,6-carboxylate N-succinyltransferase n=1 Tax=Thalassorhabdomicrobium marinisediminis TaxID=2170577 RepID=A0A2T7FVR6_9RHOB|nr:Hint domain-containing protein [Thalassorhabdomicrobium marinisediminis]PVA06255.1 2,3,4,5-tetrahydropyridine-2,6-carboxylate N-succinyltransferase [Thalassorhabdomicrobium marinisediminis]